MNTQFNKKKLLEKVALIVKKYFNETKFRLSVEEKNDLINEVFLKINKKYAKLKKVKKLENYIRVMCRNFVVDYIRKQIRERENFKTIFD